jgi:putative two-component system response regulator
MSKKILILGEDRAFVKSAQALLSRHYEAVAADDGQDALELAERVAPDLVLVEARLPGKAGCEICRALKSSPTTRCAQVIVISSWPGALEQVEALDAGADDFLVRPFPAEELLSRVHLQLRLQAAVGRLSPAEEPLRAYGSELERLVAERARNLVATQGVSLLTLRMLAESREVEAEDRLLRMGYYSTLLAAQLGRRGPYVGQIDVKFLKRLHHAVPLHDIGKIAISDSILLKRGPLTPVERKTMEEHTIIGAILLEQLDWRVEENDFLDMASVIARWHHERFDGSGYPSGLAGEEIPLPARIVALADVYDALTTPRPYRAEVTPEAARAIIDHESGRQFDPVVASAFQECFAEFVGVQERFDKDLPTLQGAAWFLE